MSEAYLSEWNPWKVTAEQLEGLRAKDRVAIDTFYFENLEMFKHLAFRYHSHCSSNHLFAVEDLIQDIYLNLFELPLIAFESVSFFVHKLKQTFYFSAFGGRWSKESYSKYCKPDYSKSFFQTELILDEPLFDDSDRSRYDLIPGGLSPHSVLMQEEERRRQDTIETDLEVLLRGLLTPRQFDLWCKGSFCPEIRRVFRRHSETLLQFLRVHGTPEYKLKGHIPSAEDERSTLSEKRAYMKWQEKHLDELDAEERRKVEHRILCRSLQRRKRAEAKKRSAQI